jgi:hypothetical protein
MEVGHDGEVGDPTFCVEGPGGPPALPDVLPAL